MKRKPHHLFLVTGLILGLMSFWGSGQSKLFDIRLHDTYFVFAYTQLLGLLAILALFVWSLYLFANKILYSRALTWIHVITTVIPLLVFALIFIFSECFTNVIQMQYRGDTGPDSFDGYKLFTIGLCMTIVVLLLGQLVFIVNFIAGIFKRLANGTI